MDDKDQNYNLLNSPILSSSKADEDNENKNNKHRVYDLDSLIDAAGGFGRIQLYCLIVCFIALNGANYYSFTLSYLELEPKLECFNSEQWISCKAKDICNGDELKPQDQWRIDWSNSESLRNWMTDMDLYCKSNFEIGLFGSLFLFGFALCGIILKLSDNFGRKPIVLFGAATNIIFVFILYFINNIYARYVTLFIYGITCAKVVCTYIYVTEIAPARAGIFCCGVINCTDIVALIPTSIYFLFISNDWRYFYIVPIVISIVIFPFVLFIPESPKYLYERGRYTELRKVIKRMAIINRVDMDHNYAIDRAVERALTIDKDIIKPITEGGSFKEEIEVEEILKDEEFSIWTELKKPKVMINLVICCIVFAASTFNYYMINFYLKYVGGNIFINVILSTISENIAYNVGSCMQSKFGTRKSFIILFIISIVFSLPLIFWDDVVWVIMVSVFCSRFGIAASFTLIYYVNQEVFPALFVPFSFTVCNFFARMIAIVAPQIAEIPKPFPVLSFVIISCISLFSIILNSIISTKKVNREKPITKNKKYGH